LKIADSLLEGTDSTVRGGWVVAVD